MLRNILLLCIVGLVASSVAQEFGARIGKRVGRIGQSNGYFYPVPNPPFSLPQPEVAVTSRPVITVRPITTTRPVVFPTFPTVGPCQVDPNCVGANCRLLGPNCGPAPTVPIGTTPRPVATTPYTTALPTTTTRPTTTVHTTTLPAPTVAITRPTTTARPVTTVAYTTARPTLGPCQVDPFCFGPNCGPVDPNCQTTTIPVRTTTQPATTTHPAVFVSPTTTALPLDYLPPVVPVVTQAPATTTRKPAVTLGPCEVDPNCVGANCHPLGPNCGPAPTIPIRTTPAPVATTPYTTALPVTTTRAATTTSPTTTTTLPATITRPATTAPPVTTTRPVVTVRTTTLPPLDYLPPAVTTLAPAGKPVTATGYDYPTPDNPLDFGPSNNQGTGLKFPTTATTTTRPPVTTTTKPTTTRRPSVEPVLTESQEEILFWDFRESIAGEPELDYPIFYRIPETAFTCEGKINGYYADEEARCQVFHICSLGVDGGVFQNSFLCPNGTIFSQESFACLWWHDVECASSEQFFNLNANIGVVPESAAKASSGAASSGSGIQISASAGAASSSSGGRAISAAASASSSTFADGNKQAHTKGGSSHNTNSY